MKSLSIKEAQTNFELLLDTVQQEPVLLQRQGQSVAMVISLAGFQQLQTLEDNYWGAQATQAAQAGFIGTATSEQLLDRLKPRAGVSKRHDLANFEVSPLSELSDLQQFVERVNQFFSQIQTWFKDELDVVTSSVQLRERGHTYAAPVLTIRHQDQEEVLATLKPVGAFVVFVEGLIEVNGWLDKAHLGYMTKEDKFLITDATSGQKHHTYKGVNQAGWYWIEDPRTKEAQLADKTVLLKLITLVSDHEF